MKTRSACLEILNRFTENTTGDSSFKSISNTFLKENNFSDLDRRFIYEISKGTVRNLVKIDYTLELFSRIKLEKIDPVILNLLRISVFQLMFLDRVPSYSVLNEAVEIAKKNSGLYASKFVNAVLRKISDDKDINSAVNLHINSCIKNFNERIGILHSFPLWIIEYWGKNFKSDKIEKICSSLNEETYNYIRINSCRINKKEFSGNYLKDESVDPSEMKDLFRCHKSADLFDDTLILKSQQDLDKKDAFKKGLFSVQDFSSQFAVKSFLMPEKNQKILDLCGAPGGKATYAAEITGDRAEILSVDKNNRRMALFKDNILRLGLNSISLFTADVSARNYLGENKKFREYFDKIFLDPPCSSFGTISKNPELKYTKSSEDVKKLAIQSLEMLVNSEIYLRPGGSIIYYTCTISSIENEDVVNGFLNRNPGKFHLIKIYNIMPHCFKSEAGFIAVIKKIK